MTSKENIDTFKTSIRESLELDDTHHRKYHMIFFQMHEQAELTVIDLCEAFEWCKHSSLIGNVYHTRIKQAHVVTVQTPLIICVAAAHVILNPEGCKKIRFECGNKTVRLCAWKEKGFTGPIFIGICLCTPNICVNCRTHASPTTILKACSRCFHTSGRVRVLYCSKECQRMDYKHHRDACTYDWSKDNWRTDNYVHLME